jgi:adenylate kinase family enzyme
MSIDSRESVTGQMDETGGARGLHEHPRIVVVGTSGSGKTTFARSLATALRRSHIELDTLHWGPSWTPKPDFRDLVRSAVSGDSWVLDGNYGSVRELVWPRATAVVWLNYPFHIVFARAVFRTVRRLVTREQLFAGNRETFRGSFLDRNGIPWWVIRTYRRRRREYPALLSQARFCHLELFEVTSPAAANALLRKQAVVSR